MRLASLEYENDDLEINAAEEKLTIFVTADSGAIIHVTPPEPVPRGAVMDSSAVKGNFVAANGTRIKKSRRNCSTAGKRWQVA